MNREKQTFNNFIVSQANEFAYNIAKTVAENPGGVHNPLFIYGKSGVGKTHLVKAIENKIKITNPDYKVLYVTAEAFCNDMLEAIENRNMRAFHVKYRSVDILLFDDFQFVSGKYMLQEELFYTLEELLNNGSQIVFSSGKPLKEIELDKDRLKNCILSGLLTDVQQPDIDTRIEIIKNKFKQYEIEIPYDIIECIAEKLEANLFVLEGVVKKLFAIYVISNKNPDKKLVDEIIESVFCLVNSNEEIAKRIIKEVSKTFGVSEYDVRANVKNRCVTSARQYAIYIIRELTDMTLDEIGGLFGDKKHSTVLYACETIEEKLEYNPALQKVIDDIIENVTGVPSKIRKNGEN